MNGWQAPSEGKRIYLVSDNSKMEGFLNLLKPDDIEQLYLSSGESHTNLGIHFFKNSLYSSNFVGICRLKDVNGNCLADKDGNELLLKVVPRFNVTVIELLNYIRDDDEFDRYLAPQTASNRNREKGIAALDKNEIFYFFNDEKPLKVDDGISSENSIITVTVFLAMLRNLCRRPLMGRMIKEEENLSGKVKGKIVIEKNISINTFHGRGDKFYCRFPRFTEDIKENQILKAALLKSKRFLMDYFGNYVNGSNHYSSLIAYCNKTLRNVSNNTFNGKDCQGLKLTGCYAYYKPVIAIARMLLDDISIESSGDVKTTGYIVPYAISMEKLFEVYVRSYLKKNGFCSYKKKGEYGIILEKFDEKQEVFVEDEDIDNPGNYIDGTIKPDIILRSQKSGKTAVFDVKYKNHNSGSVREDRLQILAYCMMTNAEHIGIILPSKVDVEILAPRKVNSMESRVIMYHQMLVGMMKEDTKVADYIKEKIFEEKIL